MQVKNLLVGIAAMSVFGASSALGADSNFTAASGDWTDPGNWDANVPGANDVATIEAGNDVFLDDDAFIGNVVLEPGATLTIPASTLLTVDGGSSVSGINTVDGNIILSGDGSMLKFVDNDQWLEGAGKVIGQHQNARIQIEDTLTVTNVMTIEGMLQLEAEMGGTATLVNEQQTASIGAIIDANANGPLQFAANLAVQDVTVFVPPLTRRPQYKASASGSTLQFLAPYTLSGNFTVSNASAQVKCFDSVSTSGSLTQTAGSVCVFYLESFAWNAGSYSGTNPFNYECH